MGPRPHRFCTRIGRCLRPTFGTSQPQDNKLNRMQLSSANKPTHTSSVARALFGGLFKLGAIGGMAFLLVIPTKMIQKLVDEREARMVEVRSELGRTWGNGVTLRGPFLRIPTTSSAKWQHLVAEEMKLSGSLEALERYRGLYRYPTYAGELTLEGHFRIPQGTDLRLEEASWFVLVEKGDARNVRLELTFGAASVRSDFKENVYREVPFTLEAPVTVESTLKSPIVHFSARLAVTGAESFQFAPIGRRASWSLSSNWAHPGFVGQLPQKRKVEETGFRARWDFLHSAPSGPLLQDPRELPRHLGEEPASGVRFVTPVGQYALVTRLVKYALFVVLLTFTTFFLFEITQKLHVHVVQYTLVGLALVIFYLLVLAQSEHMRFQLAFLVAAAAVVALVTGYTRAVLGTTKNALICGGCLSAQYAVLFITLTQERTALLVGSWAIFLALGVVMIVTRNINWSNVAAAAAPPMPKAPTEPIQEKPTPGQEQSH